MITTLLTKSGGILKPIASLLGYIMDGIFRFTNLFGIQNIGLCIIIFTIVTRIILFPMSYKQAKSQKLMSIVQPEIQAIQKKYKGREKDQQAMMLMQAEIKQTYEKYGTSMTGGIGQLIIQMPILFALYRVIMNIPAYVPSVKVYFQNIVDAIGGTKALAVINQYIAGDKTLEKLLTRARITGGELKTTDHIIDFLYNLNPTQWEGFKKLFSSSSTVIAQNYEHIQKMNTFLGIDLSSSPSSYGITSIKFWVIPLAAGLAQFLTTKLTMKQTNSMAGGNEQAAAMSKSMSYLMPVLSVIFCFSFASGIGIYWVASSLIMGIQQYFLNKHMDKMDVQVIIKQNLEKVNKKRAKKGLAPITEKTAEQNLKRLQMMSDREENKRQEQIDSTKKRIEKSNDYYNTTSIADRAKMVQQFNDRKSKK